MDEVCDQWDGLVYGNYEAVMPLPFKKKLGINYIVQPFFTRTLDICSKKMSLKNMSEFLFHIPHKFRLQEFCVEEPFPGEKKTGDKKYQSIQLHDTFEILQKNFHNNTNQNIRKARKQNLVFSEVISTDIIADNFKLLKGKALDKFGKTEYHKLKKIMDICLAHKSGHTFSVQTIDGEILASAFFMHAHNRIIYLKGSTTDSGKKCGAMHFLMAGVIEKFSNQAIILDFGGSSVASLSRFFQGFGGIDHHYFSYKKNRLPLPLRWIKK